MLQPSPESRRYQEVSASPGSIKPPWAFPNLRRQPRRVSRDRSRRFAMGFMALMVILSWLLGWGFTQVSHAQPIQTEVSPPSPTVELPTAQPRTAQPRTVDYVPQRYQLGQRLYLENCATCHIGVPPEALPSEAWRNLLQDSSHYGAEITPPSDPSRGIIWTYLKGFSRIKPPSEDRTPYRLEQSRYFKALHPQVNLPQDLSLQSCASCHPAAGQFSFRPWIEQALP